MSARVDFIMTWTWVLQEMEKPIAHGRILSWSLYDTRTLHIDMEATVTTV